MNPVWMTRHPVATYFALAYVISWAIGVPLALQAQGLTRTHLPFALHYLTAFGPALAALAIASMIGEPLAGARKQTSASLRHRVPWWIVGFGSPLMMFAAAQFAARVAGQQPPSWQALGQVHFLPALGLFAWCLWFATSGCGEEIGWRGFLLPRLQEHHSPLRSSALLTIGWAAWHIPAFFYIPGYAALGLLILPGFFFSLFAGAVVLTWLYNVSGGSVMPAILWHASFNFVTASPAVAGLTAAVTSMFVVAWAVAVLTSGGLRRGRA